MLDTWFYTCKTEDMKGTCGHLLTRKPSSLDKQWDLPNVNESELRSRPGNSVPRCSPLVRSRVNEVTVDRRKKKQTNTNGVGLTTYGGFRVQTAIGPRDRELVKDIKIYMTWFDWLWDYLIVYSSKPFNILPKLIFYVGTPDYLCDPYSSRELPIGPQEPAWLPHYSMPCFYPLPITLMRTRYMTNSVDFYHVKIEHGYGSMEGLGLKAEHWEIENNQVFDNASGKERKQRWEWRTGLCGLRMRFQFVVSFLFGGLMFSCKVTGGIKSSLCYPKCPQWSCHCS